MKMRYTLDLLHNLKNRGNTPLTTKGFKIRSVSYARGLLKAFMAIIILPTCALPQKLLVLPESQNSEDDQSSDNSHNSDFSQCIDFSQTSDDLNASKTPLPVLTEHQKEKLDDFLKEKKDFGYDRMHELNKRLTLSPQSNAKLTRFMDDFFSINFKYSQAKKDLLHLAKKHYGLNNQLGKREGDKSEDTKDSTKNIHPPIKKTEESNLTR